MANLFLDACANRPVSRTPVWLMRQAGRYMAEYRAIRERYDFWTVCRTPELAAEVTLQPIAALAPDAAILFSDILVVLPPMGLSVDFSPGPVIARPVRTTDDIHQLTTFDVHRELGFVFDALRMVRRSLAPEVALIGFGGAPLTLAAYMVEGGKTKNFEALKSLFYARPEAAHGLLDFLVDVQADFLCAQIDAGAQAIQIFDTWAGSMPRDIIAEFVIPKVASLVARVKKSGVPVIYFMKDAAHVLDLLAQTGADVLSLDEKTPLDIAAARIGGHVALQGNFDPAVLLADRETISQRLDALLATVPPGRGHIFNLGHGVLPSTPVENVAWLIAQVMRRSAR